MRAGSKSAVRRIAAPHLAPWSQDKAPSAGLPELYRRAGHRRIPTTSCSHSLEPVLLQAAYEEDLDAVFDVAAVRAALEARLRSLESELHQARSPPNNPRFPQNIP